MGGYKASGGIPNGYWKGAVVNKATWEVINGQRVRVVAAFRAYDSMYEFYKDQDLLYARSRYLAVRSALSPIEQARMLQASGYATDPDYANKLITIMNSNHLSSYDTREEREEPMTAEEKSAFAALQAAVARLSTDNETLKAELDSQQAAMQALQVEAAQLETLHDMKEIPEWAKEAVAAAVKKHLIDTPNGGSYDFYRLLSVLYRAKLI
ncbi:glucosaminidase domain-containing protein [Paenibacillus sacheonensis]|uniref:glucosaminidase domain-containing protein n=1 Tax=Paenibacillus sacheonensis TaxID=742054 RepID=UPI001EF9713F|nr:flagellar protein FlgJ [Paenibacillus sacheonensis]